MDSVTRFFALHFFHWLIFPQASDNNNGVISNFLKIREDIRKSRCTTGINDTGGKFAAGVSYRYTGSKVTIGFSDTGDKFCHRYHWWGVVHTAIPVVNNGNKIRLLTP